MMKIKRRDNTNANTEAKTEMDVKNKIPKNVHIKQAMAQNW